MDDCSPGRPLDGALIVDNGPGSVRVAGVEYQLRPLSSLLRMAALAMLAALLLVRLGPFCEAAAQAAPVSTVMAGCDGKGTGTPEKKTSASACATPCAAVRGDTLARGEPMRLASIALIPAPAPGMVGLPVAPAMRPPRLV